jgi:hypothetical protein
MSISISISACGGGGQSSSSDSDKNSDSDNLAIKQGIRIVHAAIDGSPIDVLLKTEEKGLTPIGTTRFNQANTFYLPKGTATIALAAHGAGGGNRLPISEFQITTTEDQKSSILIAGHPNKTFDTVLLVPPLPTTTYKTTPNNGNDTQKVSIRFVHGISRANEIIALANGVPVTKVKYGQVSSVIYLPVSPEISITLVRAVDYLSLGTITLNTKGGLNAGGDINGKGGDVWTIFAGGEAEYYTFISKFAD